MKISTKGRYALRMLTDIVLHQTDEYVSLKDIAERQGISKKYLEQIVPLLSKSGIIKANRGNKGGYIINGKPESHTVGEVLRATEGSLAPVACLEYEPNDCERIKECATIEIWEGLYKVITEYLDGITIMDVAEKCIDKSDHYCI
ncbi:MAG: Rrf2 family transcriptional regulator [Ruminococcus sp.]|nr:Rrf2 family transcriptional regulator [Ruminococcus sp.]